MIRHTWWLILIFLSLNSSFHVACAKENSKHSIQSKTKELKNLNQQIQGVQKQLVQAETKKNNLEHELKSLEIKIGNLANQLTNTKNNLTQQQTSLNELVAKQKDYLHQLSFQQQALVKQIRVAYVLGQDDYLKLLLNQEDPAKVSRLLRYFQYINNARSEEIKSTNQTLSNIRKTRTQIETRTQTLKELTIQKQAQEKKLTETYQERSKLLKQVNASINTSGKRLNQMLSNKKALEQLILKLQNQAQFIPQSKVPFTKMHHKLAWPTKGKINLHFGDSILNSNLHSNGVFIEAPVDQSVQAIYPGRVVFADWLRGVGLLIIIDHGQGYMTLYGHNHTLYKKMGDDVKAGDVIATVGLSGGIQKSGLYFEVRDKGKPLNPERWCR